MKPNMSNQQEGKKKKNYKNLKGINGVILLGNIKVSLVQACGWLIGVFGQVATRACTTKSTTTAKLGRSTSSWPQGQ